MKQRQKSPKQVSFASYEFAQKKRVTRREKFLAELEQVVPWARLEVLIEPAYPTSGRVGRPPKGVPLMLRMYFLQQWFGLADEALEDAIYDSQAMREFTGIDLSHETVPDATTLLKQAFLDAGYTGVEKRPEAAQTRCTVLGKTRLSGLEST